MKAAGVGRLGMECRVLESLAALDPGPVCCTLAWRCFELASLHPHHPFSALLAQLNRKQRHGREGRNPTSLLDFLLGSVQLGAFSLYSGVSDLLGLMTKGSRFCSNGAGTGRRQTIGGDSSACLSHPAPGEGGSCPCQR